MGKKKHKVEILAPIEKPVVPSASVGMALERLVEQKVSEIFSRRDGALLEPWFRTKAEADAIKRLQSIAEQRKWSVFFERHGCLSCWTKKKPHAGNGLCTVCRPKIHKELRKIVKELSNRG